MELISIAALIFWAIVQFIAMFLLFLTAVIESKFVYYLKKGVK